MVQLQQRAEQWAEQRWDPMARKFHPGATQKCGLNLDSARHVVVMQVGGCGCGVGGGGCFVGVSFVQGVMLMLGC